jgi:hypothetical protein
VLKYPKTGVYARGLLIECKGFKLSRNFVDYTGSAFTQENLAILDMFLANTPQLETVRCVRVCSDKLVDDHSDNDDIRLPLHFFGSLSKLKSLRYLHLGGFNLSFIVGPWLPRLPQVRILRYTPFSRCNDFADFLRVSMLNIRTLYVTACRFDRGGNQVDPRDSVISAIQVRCPFPVSLSLSVSSS